MSKPDAPGMSRVRKVLAIATKPMTAEEIAGLAHVAAHTFNNHYKRKLIAEGAMHVAGWTPYQYGQMHTYAAGPGEKPERPKAPPPQVAVARWKERTGYVDPRYAHRRLAKPRDKVLAALIGLRA
jgi:hypothetical protein